MNIKDIMKNVYIFTIFTILSKHLTGHKRFEYRVHTSCCQKGEKHHIRWPHHYFAHLNNITIVIHCSE